MRTRRGTARLRGWGGVGAMGAACALTGALVLALPHKAGDAHARPADGRSGVTVAARADADDCNDRSPRPSGKDGPTIDAIKNRAVKKLVVGVDQNSYRWGYRDPNKRGGALEGFDIDLAREIAEEIFGDRDAVVFRAIPTNQRIPALQSGQVDMVVRTMTVNCERLEDVDFSTGYFETGQQVLAPKKSGITGYNDTLKGKKVCSAKGSIALEELEKKSFGADISTTVPNQLDCLVRLQLGEVDAVVTDSALAASQAAQDPTVELKGKEPFTTEHYGVAMKKGSDDLVRRVNKVLQEYREDRADGWQKSYDKWLKGGLGEVSGPPRAAYRD
ncbi:glutamate ABC transporter substrate-binding protein [Streptomyces sp. G44]|uniref:glutamate ABC transporter substrate-binding protein n=1 Tax=Streptomyces sp. G44 TaxID=2807632 RepID=UPI0019609260|nr:glutamate ABC transporter substrate-binding protein [Streptomyces sp. G44]MBM7173510.1 glutamate ABC transporter substrate-binding protein [Streptomyces sp. G44]